MVQHLNDQNLLTNAIKAMVSCCVYCYRRVQVYVVVPSSMPYRSWLSMKWLEAPLPAVMMNSTGCVAMLIGGAAMKEQHKYTDWR